MSCMFYKQILEAGEHVASYTMLQYPDGNGVLKICCNPCNKIFSPIARLARRIEGSRVKQKSHLYMFALHMLTSFCRPHNKK